MTLEPQPQLVFAEVTEAFRKKVSEAKALSISVGVRHGTLEQGYGSAIFLKIIMVSESILKITDAREPTRFQLDHFSIGSMARDLVEAMIMLGYLTDGAVVDDVKRMRRTVLNLHDCTARYKMFKAWKDQEQKRGFRNVMMDLRRELTANPAFRRLPEERRKELMSGKVMYLEGMRSIVRNLDWDGDYFDGLYTYLSTYTHTSPMSYYRYNEHGVNTEAPSDFQLAFASTALGAATLAVDTAIDRVRALFPQLHSE